MPSDKKNKKWEEIINKEVKKTKQVPRSVLLKNERKFEKHEYNSDRYKLHQQKKLIEDLSEIENKCLNKSPEEGKFSPECNFKTGKDFDFSPIYSNKKKEIYDKIYHLDKQKVIHLNELKKEKKNNVNENFIGNIINFENTIREGWTDKRSDIVKIDVSLNQLEELNKAYGEKITGMEQFKKIFEKQEEYNDIIKEKTDNYDNTNKIEKRLAQYNEKEINEMDKILIWFKIIYWIGFVVIIFLLFKFKQWRNIKVYIFLLLIIFLPTLLLKPLINVITKEFFKDKVSINYILYICLLVVFIFGLYFFGKLPFVNADKDFYKNSIKKNDILDKNY